MSLTTDKNDPNIHKVKENGQNESYVILSDEERAKGFVRSVRNTYIHSGKKVEIEDGELEMLSDEDIEKWKDAGGYVARIKYPEEKLPLVCKYLTSEEYEVYKSGESGKRVGGCGQVTTMSREIAETYATNPKFYGATFCMGCRTHLPVEEFAWIGTDETVGS